MGRIDGKTFRRVVLFGIDGGGTYFEQANTPNIDRIFGNGAISRRTLTEFPTVSAECWGSMLHGVNCQRHKLTNWITDNVPYPVDSPYPSVFRVIREARPEAKLASFCEWNCINKGIIENNLGVYMYSANDFALVEPAIRYIEQNDFTLLFFQFDSVDGAGHTYGYGSPEHLAAITANDVYIKNICAAIKRCGYQDDTLFMVEADHGGTVWDGHKGYHGGNSDAEKYVLFAAAGNGVQKTELTDMLVLDTSSAILHALGIAQPENWNGRVPGGMFADCPENLPRPKGIPLLPLPRAHAQLPESGRFRETFADLRPYVYLPFDEGTPSLPAEPESHGKLYRIPGLCGKGMRFDDGWLTMPCPDLTHDFSILCWMRVESIEKTTVLCANARKPTPTGDNAPEVGFSLVIRTDYIELWLSDASRKHPHRLLSSHPRDITGGWIHMALSMDLTRKRIRLYFDFEEYVSWDMPEESRLTLGGETLYIGQDATESYPYNLPAVLDEVCICGKAVEPEDIARLKAYYQA